MKTSAEVWLRPELVAFSTAMEEKLQKNDHKTHWSEQPIEAHLRFLMVEVEEFKIADDFLTVADARKELVDIANFALILHDKLGKLHQDENRHAQSTK